MNNSLPEHEWKSGAIDFDRVPATSAGLSMLINSGGDVPIRRRVRPGIFPSFKAARFSLAQDYGYIINVWRVRDAEENYHVIGGVQVSVDKRDGYMSIYQNILNEVISNDEKSSHVFRILDHVITNSLLNRD